MTVLAVISRTIKSGAALTLDAKKCAMKILNVLDMSGRGKNQLDLGVISSMRWSTVSQSVPVNAEDHSEELVTLHGNKSEPIPMNQIYESLVNEEFRRIHILLILLYKPNTSVVIWLPVVYLSSEVKQSNKIFEQQHLKALFGPNGDQICKKYVFINLHCYFN